MWEFPPVEINVFDLNDPRVYLFSGLAILAVVFIAYWVRTVRSPSPETVESGEGASGWPSLFELVIGFGTNFFDTLGIGSFAPTTSLFKLRSVVPDEDIPGTMHTGHTPPVIIQAFIFIAIIQVSSVTLFTLIVSAVLGAWLGAGVIAKWPRRRIQIGMGLALLIAAITFLMAIYGFVPVGGAELGLSGTNLVIAALCLFILGALMTLGIGMYAPTMIVVSVMGMNPTTAFPIMMGAAAFLMPVAGMRFPPGRSLRPPRGARADDRRYPRRADRRLHRALAALEPDAMASGDRGSSMQPSRCSAQLRRRNRRPCRRPGSARPHSRPRMPEDVHPRHGDPFGPEMSPW